MFDLLRRYRCLVLGLSLLVLIAPLCAHSGSPNCVGAKTISSVLDASSVVGWVQPEVNEAERGSHQGVRLAQAVTNPPPASAARIADILQDHMVLQRGQCVPIWGTAGAGDKVTIKFNKQKIAGYCNGQGEYKLNLKPEQAGGPYELVVQTRDASGYNHETTCTDVMVGDVWLCAGQSNMDMTVNKSADKHALLSKLGDQARGKSGNAAGNQLRLFTVGKSQSYQPLSHLQGRWQVASAESAGEFSAVALSFGKKLQADLKVPVGIVVASMVASPIDPWIPERVLKDEPPYDKIYSARHSAATTGDGTTAVPLIAGLGCSTLYNAMIAPLIPFAFKGILWYQGEGDIGEHSAYLRHFPAMIDAWRVAWNKSPDHLAFIYIQLPNCNITSDKLGHGVWSQMRAAQDSALILGNTYRVSAIDLGVADNLHPPHKLVLGERSADVALSNVYHKAGVEISPEPASVGINGNHVAIVFAHTGGALNVTGDKCFELCGKDGIFHPARVKIERDTVNVWSDSVAEPREVRYAWADAPEALLVNAAKIPAAPFRRWLLP